MRCCRIILMKDELKYLQIYVIGAMTQLLVMRDCFYSLIILRNGNS